MEDDRPNRDSPPAREEEPAWASHPMADSLSGKECLALIRAGQAVHSTLDPDRVFELALRHASRLLEADASSVWLLDETGERLVARAATGAKANQLKLFHLSPGVGIVGRVVQERRPFVTNDAAAEASCARDVSRILEYDVKTLLCVPLCCADRTLGAVEVLNKSGGRPFTDKDAFLLTVLADTVAQAWENARRAAPPQD